MKKELVKFNEKILTEEALTASTPKKGIELCKKLIDNDPKNPHHYFLMANYYRNINNYKKALEVYNQCNNLLTKKYNNTTIKKYTLEFINLCNKKLKK